MIELCQTNKYEVTRMGITYRLHLGLTTAENIGDCMYIRIYVLYKSCTEYLCSYSIRTNELGKDVDQNQVEEILKIVRCVDVMDPGRPKTLIFANVLTAALDGRKAGSAQP